MHQRLSVQGVHFVLPRSPRPGPKKGHSRAFQDALQCVIVTGILLSTTVPSLAASSDGLHESFTQEGNMVVVVQLHLPVPAVVSMSAMFIGPDDDVDWARYMLVRNRDNPDDVRFSWHGIASHSGGAEEDAFLGVVDANVVPEAAKVTALGKTIVDQALIDLYDDKWGLSVELEIEAGDWTMVAMTAASRPYDETIFRLDVDRGQVEASWRFRPDVQLVTIRNMDGGMLPHQFARVLGFGAAAALDAEARFDVEEALVGFTWYLPGGGFDQHDFRLEGPAGTRTADELFFAGEASGTYRLTLQALSAGEWPARAVALIADINPSR